MADSSSRIPPTNAILGQLGQAAKRVATLEQNVEELKSLMKASQGTPRWIEQLPGRRVPYWAAIDITIAASSTSRVEGSHTVSTDGPLVINGIAMFFQRTSSPYNGFWVPATTVEARIAPATQTQGVGGLLDSPVLGSFDVEFTEAGADRNWQNSAFASALFSPAMGGTFVLPVSHLVPRASVITAKVTPTFAQTVAGKVEVILCGYKIVQGDTYQP